MKHTPERDAARGVELACEALHAIADQDDRGALNVLNRATHVEAVWAAAYLLSAVRAAVSSTVGHDVVRTSEALHSAADDGLAEDPLHASVDVILDEALEREGI